jgi:hypothetical protein
MADVDLTLLVQRIDRLIVDVAALRDDVAAFRDELRVQGAMIMRLEGAASLLSERHP